MTVFFLSDRDFLHDQWRSECGCTGTKEEIFFMQPGGRLRNHVWISDTVGRTERRGGPRG